MNYVIHLTQCCNLNCKYCYEKKLNKNISFENIKMLIDNEINNKSDRVFLDFYGGEPLLRKDLIYKTIEYINGRKTKTKFKYGITTNGVLLDDIFIDFMKKNNFKNIAYSFDGIEYVQNLNRITVDGNSTFDIVNKNAKILLNEFSQNVVAMVVVAKNNILKLNESVEYLLNIGFKRINLLFNYLDNWEDEDLEIIRSQYKKVADLYVNNILEEKDMEIFVFDDKIKSYIEESDCNKNCELGMKSINVGTDGNFYPCMQFAYNKDFIIGNCNNGIDLRLREKLIKSSMIENSICKECSLRNRCNHVCACKNYMLTKNINKLSPLICEFEKIIIEISDDIAQKLYKQKSKLFIQKFYNKKFHVLKAFINSKKYYKSFE